MALCTVATSSSWTWSWRVCTAVRRSSRESMPSWSTSKASNPCSRSSVLKRRAAATWLSAACSPTGACVEGASEPLSRASTPRDLSTLSASACWIICDHTPLSMNPFAWPRISAKTSSGLRSRSRVAMACLRSSSDTFPSWSTSNASYPSSVESLLYAREAAMVLIMSWGAMVVAVVSASPAESSPRLRSTSSSPSGFRIAAIHSS
mmetsp:Transcript_1025/g.2563  ORF Transcript_1025/g.2563 Transcript_1025/m.2563 type:complete len:206 (-) Transcript_1025:272-889(-)